MEFMDSNREQNDQTPYPELEATETDHPAVKRDDSPGDMSADLLDNIRESTRSPCNRFRSDPFIPVLFCKKLVALEKLTFGRTWENGCRKGCQVDRSAKNR